MLSKSGGLALAMAAVVGGALTLFCNLRTLLQVEEHGQWLVAFWLTGTQTFWAWLSGVIAIPVAAWLIGPLTIGFFLLLAAVGRDSRPSKLGSAPELVGLVAIVAIIYWGYQRATGLGSIFSDFPILLAQTAILLVIFGLGTLNRRLFVRRIWIMLLTVTVLIGSNEILKLAGQRSSLAG